MKAVAVFEGVVSGIVLFTQEGPDIRVDISIQKCPPGNHGLHIHKAGDLREGCKSLCEHQSQTKAVHGGPPPLWFDPRNERVSVERHTGDLGNINATSRKRLSYRLVNVSLVDLQGRSVIVHRDLDDEGHGPFEDSKITGHSGDRIACAIIGRVCS